MYDMCLLALMQLANSTLNHCLLQALQAPACHENMVKVGGYILGEFGNLIAGDPRSRYGCSQLLEHKGFC